ncbi:hypothetical protein [uncultured Aquimarina sp.]|uniref:hypothetical protein n=1 Tax=uncultured Aquimarina sp. TaxID=575652 RepID=UPI0026238A0F|nr:hypothetical protein [uncultured Aquimarina sp.]
MKKEILNRIQKLGGDISNVRGKSLQNDLESISFNTVLYPKRSDTPWASIDEQEPIYGIGEFIEGNKELFESNKIAFYDVIINHYYKLTEEGFGQVFFRNDLFTPFKQGTDDYDEWNGEWEESSFRKVINGTEMDLMFIGHSYGFPDNLFICLTDSNQENPTVYGTDHEVYFDEITKEGTLEEFFNSFLTKEELIEIIKKKLEK